MATAAPLPTTTDDTAGLALRQIEALIASTHDTSPENIAALVAELIEGAKVFVRTAQ